jgi:hypothetical protein
MYYLRFVQGLQSDEWKQVANRFEGTAFAGTIGRSGSIGEELEERDWG